MDLIQSRLNHIENNILRIEEKFDLITKIQSTHLLRIKNHEELSDDYVLNQRAYNDLSPEKAARIYHDTNADFILLDVSEINAKKTVQFKEALNIPLEQIASRTHEIPNQAASIMVISEDGTRSILACEILNQLGYFNISNISGGHQYWPVEKSKLRSA